MAVAFSGGRDSLALLHVTARSAASLGLRVVALHVHHGLMPDADAWVRRARRLCNRWRSRGLPVTLMWRRVEDQPSKGQSIEAWARGVRYAALADMAHCCGATLVLLAHHRRDQAETVLLQALRGAGAKGLAAMPKSIRRHGLTWCRPWIDQPREHIEAYVRGHRLRATEDPSNADPRFARNRLRLQVWPALTDSFPHAEAALASTASMAAEAAQALAELAEIDWQACRSGDGLCTQAWSALSTSRRANLLRAWLRHTTGRGAGQALIQRLMSEIPGRVHARWPCFDGLEIRLYRGRLELVAVPASVHPKGRLTVDLSVLGQVPVAAWGGGFIITPCERGGIAIARLASAELRPREGGETLQLAPGRPARRLKKQFQASHVAGDDRSAPLVWVDGALAFVPGIGLDTRQWAPEGQPMVMLRWYSDPP